MPRKKAEDSETPEEDFEEAEPVQEIAKTPEDAADLVLTVSMSTGEETARVRISELHGRLLKNMRNPSTIIDKLVAGLRRDFGNKSVRKID